MIDVNQPGVAHARALIAAGKVDTSSAWSFEASDGNLLLGPGGDRWSIYGRAHLGVDRSAGEDTKARWKYPFEKLGKVYRSGIVAAKDRAGQQGDAAVEDVAGALLKAIDADGKSAAAGLETKIAPFEFKFLEENGTAPGQFEGYGSVFGNLDTYGDVMEPGAFDVTLARARATGRMPKMLLNHGGLAPGMAATPHDLLPIGKWNALSPDTAGLAAKGRLINLDTESGKRIYGAMKEGELTDLSIGYVARKWQPRRSASDPRRRLQEVQLNEISPVTFGANPQATISAVKAAAASLTDMRELEAALRDEGLSRSDAVTAIAVFKSRLLQRDAGDLEPALRDAASTADVRDLVARIRAASA